MLLEYYWIDYGVFIEVKKSEKNCVWGFFIKKCRNWTI